MLSKRCIGCLVIFAVLVWFGCHSKSGSKFATDVHKYRKIFKDNLGDDVHESVGSNKYAANTAYGMNEIEKFVEPLVSNVKHYQSKVNSYAKDKYEQFQADPRTKNLKEDIASKLKRVQAHANSYMEVKDTNDIVNDKKDTFHQGTQMPVDGQSSDTDMYAQSNRTDTDNQSSGTDTDGQSNGPEMSIFEERDESDGFVEIDNRYEMQDEVSGNTKGQK
eukprot:370933_1